MQLNIEEIRETLKTNHYWYLFVIISEDLEDIQVIAEFAGEPTPADILEILGTWNPDLACPSQRLCVEYADEGYLLIRSYFNIENIYTIGFCKPQQIIEVRK